MPFNYQLVATSTSPALHQQQPLHNYTNIVGGIRKSIILTQTAFQHHHINIAYRPLTHYLRMTVVTGDHHRRRQTVLGIVTNHQPSPSTVTFFQLTFSVLRARALSVLHTLLLRHAAVISRIHRSHSSSSAIPAFTTNNSISPNNQHQFCQPSNHHPSPGPLYQAARASTGATRPTYLRWRIPALRCCQRTVGTFVASPFFSCRAH